MVPNRWTINESILRLVFLICWLLNSIRAFASSIYRVLELDLCVDFKWWKHCLFVCFRELLRIISCGNWKPTLTPGFKWFTFYKAPRVHIPSTLLFRWVFACLFTFQIRFCYREREQKKKRDVMDSTFQVLEGVIKYRWNALPVEQRDGMKNYISEVIVQV